MKALAKEPEKTVSVWKCENPNGGSTNILNGVKIYV